MQRQFALHLSDLPAFAAAGGARADSQDVRWIVDVGDALLDYQAVRNLDSLRSRLLSQGITLILGNPNCVQKAMLHCFDRLNTYCPLEPPRHACAPDTQKCGIWSRLRLWLECPTNFGAIRVDKS
jgi:hypothetical protein